MGRITQRIIEQYQDGKLKGKPLNLLDLVRLGFPENEVDRVGFVDYLERAIKRGRLKPSDEEWIQTKKFRQDMRPIEFFAAHVAVPVITPAEFRRFLEHSEPYHPPLHPYLLRWCAPPAPAPALPQSPPAAPPVDASRRPSVALDDDPIHQALVSQGRKGTDKQHAAKREKYAKLLELAKKDWQNDSPLRHDQMADKLMLSATGDKEDKVEISRETLLEKLKEVLEEIGRPGLIRGIKKEEN